MLVALLALAAGFVVSVAQTRCIRAIADRRKLAAAGWDLAISVLALAVIYEHSPLAFATFAIGSAAGTWYSA